MKKQLVMLANGEKLPLDYTATFNPLPSALVSLNGMPNKGNKSNSTDFLESKKSGVIVTAFLSQWRPESVVCF